MFSQEKAAILINQIEGMDDGTQIMDPFSR